ncbi:hypothetical protein GHT06_018540 [Daphnia sinensis]|uniref:Uncharacterized protein n=1 Tax=Daphnia sinensis TaxID=1820382 RepID=A0AAD5KNY2_9CRUS|nr:hypothetical protein GHT06_018540 [Daphnia sinensis]
MTIATTNTTTTATSTATTSRMTGAGGQVAETGADCDEIGQGQLQDGTRRMRRSSKGVRGVLRARKADHQGRQTGSLLRLYHRWPKTLRMQRYFQELSQEISSLLSAGVSTDQSKLLSKEFPIAFEEENFTLKPPKLDGWMSRRARDKNTLKTVNSSEESLIKTQLKIMDIGQPLIDLYVRVVAVAHGTPAGVRSRRSLQAALQQWGRAYAHISRKRRETIVNATDPRIDYLLKDETVFTRGKEACEHLFTGEFLDLMLKEASQDEVSFTRLRVCCVCKDVKEKFHFPCF